MKKILILATILLPPALGFAQTTPKPPAAWVAFQQQENIKRAAFNRQMSAERQAFLNANPDVKEYLDQARAIVREKMLQYKANHPFKNPI